MNNPSRHPQRPPGQSIQLANDERSSEVQIVHKDAMGRFSEAHHTDGDVFHIGKSGDFTEAFSLRLAFYAKGRNCLVCGSSHLRRNLSAPVCELSFEPTW